MIFRKKTAGHFAPGRFVVGIFRYYFVAGAAGAAGAAGVASGAGAGVASGAGAGAGAAVSAGFCSSAFLQPTTANDIVTKKSRLRIIADTFFIDTSPPFTDFIPAPVRRDIADAAGKILPFFALSRQFSHYIDAHLQAKIEVAA
jgi:hypothetical protein